MRILYIHQHFATNDDIGATRSYDLARMLVSRGHHVTVISGNVNYQTGRIIQARCGLYSREVEDGIEVIRIDLPFRYHEGTGQRIALFLGFMCLSSIGALTMHRPDVVFATSTPLTVGIPALLAHWCRGVPYIFEVRDLWPDAPIQYGMLKNPLAIKLAYSAESICYRFASQIVTISPWMDERFYEKGVPASKIRCVPIGADIDLFHPELADQRDVRTELGLRPDELLVVYAGTHGIVNALDTLVEAAGLLKGEPVHFLLVGDGGQKASLQSRARALGINQQITFRPPCPRKELGPILANADICVITARGLDAAQAIFPNKLFDYLACGKPVLVNFKGVTADLLTRTGTGIIVRCEDPAALAAAVRDLSVNRPLLHLMGARARQVAEKWGRSTLYESLVKLIESAQVPS